MNRRGIRILVLTIALIAAAASIQAKPLLGPKTIDVNAGIGYGYGWGGLDLAAGAEYVIGSFSLGDLPFSYGAAGRVGLGLGSQLSFGVAALGTLHFSWNAIPWPSGLQFLDNLDSYFGLGLRVLPNLGIDAIGGSNYFITPKIALNVESGLVSTTIGVLLKL